MRAAGAASAAILLAACGVSPDIDPPAGSAPVIVTGVVVDAGGRPVEGARMRLEARDWVTIEHNSMRTGMATGALTDARGRFEIRGAPPTAIDMERPSGSIEFELTSWGPVWCASYPYEFSRSGDFETLEWKEPAPDLRLTASERCDLLPGTS